ncbi:MAG: hypothetical protein V1784_04035 [bacterium]
MIIFLRYLAIISAGTLLIFPDGLFAQDMPRDRLRDKVETVIIGKFAESLDLTPDQAEKFYPRLRQYQRSMEEMQRGQRELRDQLDRLSDAEDSSPEEVARLLDRLSENQRRMVGEKRGFLGEVSPFMSPQQVSRCSILMDEIPQRVREMIRERRDLRDGSPPPPARRPPPRGRRR